MPLNMPSMPGLATLIDTHAHLCDPQFDADRPEALSRALNQGIGTIVEIADEPAGWDRARDLALGSTKASSASATQSSPSNLSAQPNVFWTCGFHPHYAMQGETFDFAAMREAGAQERCVGIGEIGLDYVKSEAPKEAQAATFRKALEAAAEINKPVVIHCREAQADTLRILKSFYAGTSRRDSVTGVIHCFSGDAHFAEGCLDLGFYLGVDGPITYPSAKALREVIAQVPLDRVVLETDSPYLPPQKFRGQRNESAHLTHIADKICELFGKSIDEISQITTQNAKNLFRLHAAP